MTLDPANFDCFSGSNGVYAHLFNARNNLSICCYLCCGGGGSIFLQLYSIFFQSNINTEISN